MFPFSLIYYSANNIGAEGENVLNEMLKCKADLKISFGISFEDLFG